MKQLSVFQKGTFNHREKEYNVALTKTSKGELANFYSEDLLICSVYTEYLSKVVGAEDNGDFTREVYGGEDIFTDFITNIITARNKPNNGLIIDKKELITEAGLTSVITRKSVDFYHSQTFVEGTLMDENIQLYNKENDLILEINYYAEKFGKGIKLLKEKDVDYKQKQGISKDIKHLNIRSISEIELEKDLSWMKTKKYEIIDTVEEFDAYVAKIAALKDIVGFDTETTGLRINRFPVGHPERDRLTGICLSIDENEGVYIPVFQKRFDNLPEEYVIESLRPYIDINSEQKKSLATHFGSFDWKVMFTYGIDLNIVEDTYILQYLIDVRNAKAVKKLKDMSKLILGIDMVELSDFFHGKGKKRPDISFSMLPYESVRYYAPADSDSTRSLVKVLKPRLPKSLEFIYGVEINLVRYIGKLEYYGIRVDIQKAIEMKKESEDKRVILEKEIYNMCGEQFAITSAKQLGNVLFNKLEYPILAWTKGSEKTPPSPATGSKVLDLLSRVKKQDSEPDAVLSEEFCKSKIFKQKELDDIRRSLYPVAKLLDVYKKENKLITAFFNKLLKDNIEGFIFPRYNQAGTESGRIAGYGPNLQQTSRKIRKLFIPDSEEYYMIIVDYSQIEYRVMAGLGKEKEVVERFQDPEADYHVMMYSLMRQVKEEEVNSEQRREGKTLNFGVSFGMGDHKLAIELFGSATDENVEKASGLKALYFDSVPNIRDMFTEVKDLAELNGYVETLFCRRRYFDPEDLLDYRKREGVRRKAGNTRVQGTAADILKMAHCRLEIAFAKHELDARIIASVHDEFIIMVNKKYNAWWMIDQIRQQMELNLEAYGFPPLYIGATVGKTWADGKDDSLEIPVLLSNKRCEEARIGLHSNQMIDPYTTVKQEIYDYVTNLLSELIIANRVTSVEDAKKVAKITGLIGKFFNKSWDIIDSLLLEGLTETVSDLLISDNSEREEDDMLTEELMEMDREDLIDDEDDNFGEESVYVDELAVRRMYKNPDVKIELKEPTISTAVRQYVNDYRILVSGGKCIIRVQSNNDLLVELRDYLDANNAERGTDVYIDLDRKNIIATNRKLTKINRLEILDILDKYEVMGVLPNAK